MRLPVLLRLLAVCLAASLTHPAAATELPTISDKLRLHYDVRPDGSYDRTVYLERRAGTDGEARTLAVLPWDYDPTRERVDIVAAYTLKTDGRKLDVDPASIVDQTPSPSSPLAPLTVLHQKLLHFPSLNAGDSIVLRLRDRLFRPQLPGLFSTALSFDRTQSWDDVRLTVSVPGSMKLYWLADGPVASAIGDGAEVTYAWDYRHTDYVAMDTAMLAPIERLPQVLVSTAADWQQIGAAYAALALPKAAVTVQVDDTADVQSHGLPDRDHRAIAVRLYDWVRNEIRYVPVPLGQTAIVPPGADAVLADRAADSAGKAVLLMALLKAKGIASELVLTTLDNIYRLRAPVPFIQLNHVLLYLPEFQLYADPSAGLTRFGVLPFNEYGKPAVFATAAGRPPGRLPLLQPDEATTSFTTTAHLTADDMIVGDSRTEATGPFATTLRGTAAMVARAIAAKQDDSAANAQLRALSQVGTGSFDPPPPETTDGPFVLSGHFSIAFWPLLGADHHLTIPDGLRLLPRPGDLLIGPLSAANLPANEATPCFAGRQVSTVSLDVGPKYRVTQLPDDRKIVRDAFSYQSHWSLQGSVVTVRREFDSRIAAPVCDGRLRIETAAALYEIRQDEAATVTLQ